MQEQEAVALCQELGRQGRELLKGKESQELCQFPGPLWLGKSWKKEGPAGDAQHWTNSTGVVICSASGDVFFGGPKDEKPANQDRPGLTCTS